MDTISDVARKPLVIYHGNCADGFAAAWCFHHKDPNGYEFHAGVYQEPPPDVAGRLVYLVDFSYKPAVLEQMSQSAREIVILDHHKSAIEDIEDWLSHTHLRPLCCPITCVFDMNRSGAGITWDYIFPDRPRPDLLNHVEDRDLWKFKLEGTREIQAAVFSYPYDFHIWDKLMFPYPDLDLAQEGIAIERKHHKDIAELLEVCTRTMNIGGYNVLAASLPYTMSSDAGMALAIKSGKLTFGACYWDTPTHRIFSLRSYPEGLDVSEIAKGYGGGGHKHAAGFKVSRDHPLAKV